MKKSLVVAVALLLGISVAYAGTLSVPFFRDRVGVSDLPAGWIGIKNQTTSDIVVAIKYTRANGQDRTPAANTFLLQAQQAVSYRPVCDDSATEGPGAAVPNMTMQSGDNGNGSVTYTWVGGNGDIVGRYLEWESSSLSYVPSMYLLPNTCSAAG